MMDPYPLVGDSDAVVDAGDGADRNGDPFVAPEVTLVEQDVCDVVIAGIDHHALDPSDSLVGGVDVFAAAYLYLARGYMVVGDRLGTGTLA